MPHFIDYVRNRLFLVYHFETDIPQWLYNMARAKPYLFGLFAIRIACYGGYSNAVEISFFNMGK